MLSEPIKINQIDAAEIIPHLYAIFRRDFIDSAAILGGKIWVDPQVSRKSEGKEETFWHLTSRDDYTFEYVGGQRIKKWNARFTDFDRSCRLAWVREIIDNHSHQEVSLFYHRETTGKKNIRLYLWAHAEKFVVILQKLGKSSTYLVTSFYVDNEGKESDYTKRLSSYHAESDADLKGCEWF
ncbi:MAG: RlfB protein [Pseudomonadota bacterium]